MVEALSDDGYGSTNKMGFGERSTGDNTARALLPTLQVAPRRPDIEA